MAGAAHSPTQPHRSQNNGRGDSQYHSIKEASSSENTEDPTELVSSPSQLGPSKKGRPSNSSYIQQDGPDYGFSTERIEENYPFFGTLLKREEGTYRRKEVIKKSDAKDLEWVKSKYGGGAYQVRQKLEGGQERKINFNVSGVKKAESASQQDPSQRVIDEQYVAGLRKELKEEIRNDYEDEITRLEQRLARRNQELDEYASKVRRLTVELAETDRQAAHTVRHEIKQFEDKVDRLKEEKRDLEFQVFELEQEIKWSDAGGFDLQGMLKEAAQNPDVQKLLAPILANLFGGGNIPQQAQPVPLNGRANPESQTEPPQQESFNSDASEDQPQQESSQQEIMSQKLQQFKTGVIQTVASSMVHGQPEATELKQLVTSGLADLQQSGIEPEPGMWAGIAKQLVTTALQHSVSPEKAAGTIRPVLEQVGGAADKLKYIPAKAAAEFLIGNYNIEVTDMQKEFLVKILDVFKQQLKKS